MDIDVSLGANVRLRRADESARDICWFFWREAVRPAVAPFIVTRFNREWDDIVERKGFDSWWTPSNTFLVVLDELIVGWFRFEYGSSEIQLINFSISSAFRRRGIATRVMAFVVAEFDIRGKPIKHTILKDRESHSPYESFFEKFGFERKGEEHLTLVLVREPTASAKTDH